MSIHQWCEQVTHVMHDFGVFINITKAIFVKLTQKIHQIHTVSNQLGYKAKLQQRQMACFCYNNTNKSNDPIEKEIRKKRSKYQETIQYEQQRDIWSGKTNGDRFRDIRDKSAKCITLMKYHDSLTVRPSSSWFSSDAVVSSRRGRCCCHRCPSSACRSINFKPIWETRLGVWRAWNWLLGEGNVILKRFLWN